MESVFQLFKVMHILKHIKCREDDNNGLGFATFNLAQAASRDANTQGVMQPFDRESPHHRHMTIGSLLMATSYVRLLYRLPLLSYPSC